MGLPLSHIVRTCGKAFNYYGGNRLVSNSDYVTGASGLSTSNFKVEAEAPYTHMRVCIGMKNNTGTIPTFSALVAATETMAIDTVSNAYLPRSGGSANNAVVSSGNGWKAVTWGGQATVNPALALTGTNDASFVASDWMACPSIARTDSVGARPAALLKIAQQNASGVFTIENTVITTYQGGRGNDWYREYVCGKTANDGVTTIGNIPASMTQNSGVYAWLEFKYAVPTRSVAIVGESTMSCAFSTYKLDAWVRRALMRKSTQSAPISVINVAGSGHTPTQYLAQLQKILDAGVKLTDVVMPCWSQNGFVQTDAGADALIAQNLAMVTALRALGIKVWLTTGYGVNGYTGVPEAARRKCVAWGKSMAGLVTVLDTDAQITDYSVANSSSLLASYDNGDHVHANPAGQLLLETLLYNAWV